MAISTAAAPRSRRVWRGSIRVLCSSGSLRRSPAEDDGAVRDDEDGIVRRLRGRLWSAWWSAAASCQGRRRRRHRCRGPCRAGPGRAWASPCRAWGSSGSCPGPGRLHSRRRSCLRHRRPRPGCASRTESMAGALSVRSWFDHAVHRPKAAAPVASGPTPLPSVVGCADDVPAAAGDAVTRSAPWSGRLTATAMAVAARPSATPPAAAAAFVPSSPVSTRPLLAATGTSGRAAKVAR